MEGEAASQALQADWRCWKRPGDRWSPGDARRNAELSTCKALSLWKDTQSVVICYSRERRPVQASTLGVQEKTQDGGLPHPPCLTDRRPGIHLSSRSRVHLLVQPTTPSPWTPQSLHPPTCPAPLCSSYTAGLTLEDGGAAENPLKAGGQV